MDGTLRVYDVAAPGMNPVQVLAGHENTFAKGCAFDPAGRLLASQGDDARVILWSTDTWQAVHVIREPFLEGGGLGSYVNTMYTRLTWAPDGQCLIVPNCQDANRMPYAQTVMRSKWNEVRRVTLSFLYAWPQGHLSTRKVFYFSFSAASHGS